MWIDIKECSRLFSYLKSSCALAMFSKSELKARMSISPQDNLLLDLEVKFEIKIWNFVRRDRATLTDAS